MPDTESTHDRSDFYRHVAGQVRRDVLARADGDGAW